MGPAFRWLAFRYTTIVHERVRLGEQLRAIYQGRDQRWGDHALPVADARHALGEVKRGRLRQPHPIADHYHDLCSTERDVRKQLEAHVTSHPAWPWMSGIRGIGPTLATQLLSRLDRTRAPRPSSFWAFCGLATEPAYLAQCSECGARFEVAEVLRPPRAHRPADGSAGRCRGLVLRARVDGPGKVQIRVASGRAGSIVRNKYDQRARVTCHLIGVSMLRTRGTYEAVYREAYDRFASSRPGWPPARIHLSAMRVMEKRFLLDLWHAWPGAADTSIGRSRRGSAPGISIVHPIETSLTSAVSPGRPRFVS